MTLIVSRPQPASFIAFLLFLLIAFALVMINVLSLVRDPHPPWFNYLIVITLSPVALLIGWKTIFRYKVITMGEGKISLTYPQFGITRTYALKEVVAWKETVIKTGKSSIYKELEVIFTDRKKITMAFKEYTEYDKMLAYLASKAGKQKVAI